MQELVIIEKIWKVGEFPISSVKDLEQIKWSSLINNLNVHLENWEQIIEKKSKSVIMEIKFQDNIFINSHTLYQHIIVLPFHIQLQWFSKKFIVEMNLNKMLLYQ